jgi:hypothetical protein
LRRQHRQSGLSVSTRMASSYELCPPKSSLGATGFPVGSTTRSLGALVIDEVDQLRARARAMRTVLLLIAVPLASCAAHNSDRAVTPRTPSPPPGPTATPIRFDATAPLCAAADLSFRPTGQVSQMTQDRGELIEVTNRSHHTCRLLGAPRASGKKSDGVVATVPSYGPHAGRVSIRPGERAMLNLWAPAECGAGLNGPPFYTELFLVIGRRTVDVRGVNVPGRCDVLISEYYPI